MGKKRSQPGPVAREVRPPKVRKKGTRPDGDGAPPPLSLCALCHRGRDPINKIKGKEDPLECGRFYSLNGIHLHFNCILFSGGARQDGQDHQGLNGFLDKEIKRVVRESKKLICGKCSQGGATAKCVVKNCREVFHYPCNLLAGGVFVFDSLMKSYCKKHIPVQTAGRIKQRVDDDTCLACQETIVPDGRLKSRSLVSPCCGRRFHCVCLQKTALYAGQAHFRCPGCLTQDQFSKEAVRMGIYLPVQDAAWENPEEEQFYGFTEMGRLHQRCDVPTCLNPKGRENHLPGTPFELIRCSTCGSKGMHVKCGKLKKKEPKFSCEDHEEDEEEEEEEESRPSSEEPRPVSSASSSSLEVVEVEDEKVKPPRETSSSSEEDDDVVLEIMKRRQELKKSQAVKMKQDSDEESSDGIHVLEQLSPGTSNRRSKDFVESLGDDAPTVNEADFERPGPASSKKRKRKQSTSPQKKNPVHALPANVKLVPFENNSVSVMRQDGDSTSSVSFHSANRLREFFEEERLQEQERREEERVLEQQRKEEERLQTQMRLEAVEKLKQLERQRLEVHQVVDLISSEEDEEEIVEEGGIGLDAEDQGQIHDLILLD